MRRAILALAIALAACHRAETFDAKPPKSLPDRMTAIRNEMPVLFAKPEPSMVGCYRITGEDPALPTEVELTSEPRKDDTELQQHYVMHLRGPSAREFGWTTWIATNHGIQISMSNGFTGWVIDVQKTTNGFSGTAKWFSDAGGFREPIPVTVTEIECR